MVTPYRATRTLGSLVQVAEGPRRSGRYRKRRAAWPGNPLSMTALSVMSIAIDTPA